MSSKDEVIEFENKSGDKYYIQYHHDVFKGQWNIIEERGYGEELIASFKLLEQAKKCAEILKESV